MMGNTRATIPLAIHRVPTASPMAVPRTLAGKISAMRTQVTVPDCLANTNSETMSSTR